MSIKLKRSLFIGLGGTGLKSIVHTKKRFIDTYGEIPPMVGFLAFDTDNDGINFRLDNHLGTESIRLDKSEFLHTKVQNPQQILIQNPDLFDFVPEKNKKLLTTLVKGAGQVRSNGRFAVHFNYGLIYNAIQSKLTSILSADGIANPKFTPNGSDVEVNMMFSVAGGTGSGTFIDVAYIVKEVLKSINATVGVSTVGFAILPDVFNAMMTGPAMQNVLPNGYGALEDLDFLMHQDLTKTPLQINYSGKSIEINTPPFDLVFVINNKDRNANTYTKVDDLSELIGLAMFTGSSELSGGMASSYDNVKAVLAGGAMRVENKESWACGLGLSELFYDGNKLGNIYARKASAVIINNLLTPETDSFNLADIFIDRVKIRENNGDENNELIDSLLSDTPKILYTLVEDIENIEGETLAYIGNVETTAKNAIEINYTAKFKSVVNKLEVFVIDNINKSSGVGNISKFLDGLRKQTKLFLGEMVSEQDQFKDNSASFKNQLEQSIAYLKVFGFLDKLNKRKVEDAKDDIVQSVNQVANNVHELYRRQYAISFFNELLDSISREETRINDIKFKLKKVEDSSNAFAVGLQNQVNEEPKKFVKELHRDYVNKVKVSDEDININEFIQYFPSENGIIDFAEVSEKLIESSLWKFTKDLPKALEYRNKSIDEVLSEYSSENLESLIKELIIKSNPLWSYDYKGYIINRMHHEAFIIGVPNLASSVIKQSGILDGILDANQKVSFNSTSMKDRVVIYRMEATAPIYAVTNMTLYKERRDSSNISHNIDANWLLRMDRENFDIYPTKKEDNNLQFWVTGLIYGFIKHDGEKYMAYSMDQGDPIEDYWLELGKYRDEAFDAFKRLKLQDEMKDLMDAKISKMGDTVNQNLINDVVEGTNFSEIYSQKDFVNSDLKDSKMIKVRELFTDEINFVKKELSK